MKKLVNISVVMAILWGMLSVAYVQAQKTEEVKEKTLAPDVVITELTSELLSMARTGKETLDSNPEEYFGKMRTLLEPAVDFTTIAKHVMGKRYWTQASEKQQAEFVEAFTAGLVKTYGKGMANFSDLEIKLDSSNPAEKSINTYYVMQSVKTDSGVNKILYTMRKDDVGWRVRNVVLDGVNLGKTFQTQFAQAVKDNKGDIASVIATWGNAGS